jgi:hypothetical protein
MDDEFPSDVRLLVDCASLEKSNSGPIWGRVCFAVADQFFPDAGWTDIAVAFCLHWVEGLRRLASRETTTASVFFMDGPFRADLKRASAESVELTLVNFRTDEVVEHRSEQGIRPLLHNAVACGQSVLHSANEHDWADDHDIQSLRGAVSAANSLLSI